jgi:hypothetical protein
MLLYVGSFIQVFKMTLGIKGGLTWPELGNVGHGESAESTEVQNESYLDMGQTFDIPIRLGPLKSLI